MPLFHSPPSFILFSFFLRRHFPPQFSCKTFPPIIRCKLSRPQLSSWYQRIHVYFLRDRPLRVRGSDFDRDLHEIGTRNVRLTDYGESPAATSFEATVKRLQKVVKARPYGEALTVDHVTQCLVHFAKNLLPTCFGEDFSFSGMDGDILDQLIDVKGCCASLNAVIDEGMCLCEPRTSMGGTLEKARPLLPFASLCGARFPIPADPDELPSVLELDECQEFVKASSKGAANPKALGLTEKEYKSASPSTLPKFEDIYQKPKGGIYNVGRSMIDVMRPSNSTLINKFSKSNQFVADVIFPKTLRGDVTGQRKTSTFPIVGFVPGFKARPKSYIRTLEYIASLGIIVVSPRSSFHLDVDLTEENVHDWAKDPVYAVQHVIRLGKKQDSILTGLVDENKVSYAGHSMGGAASLVSAELSQREGLPVKSVVAIAPACLFLGSQCESPYKSIPKLRDIDVLFIVGSEDRLTPPKTSRIFKSWLHSSTRSEMILMEGATHCFVEVDPIGWPSSNNGCGRGDVHPQEAIRKLQLAIGKFFKNSILEEKD
ncbi:LOW QUALITY PROTEIN: hypothetical protein BSKO_07700 [Bryopsis sp. KO-2023]|nr:LOW QUALITY PROTEIN: hypothetical protein BSKO_07700 [Bryopsis sp. KO-2023]